MNQTASGKSPSSEDWDRTSLRCREKARKQAGYSAARYIKGRRLGVSEQATLCPENGVVNVEVEEVEDGMRPAEAAAIICKRD